MSKIAEKARAHAKEAATPALRRMLEALCDEIERLEALAQPATKEVACNFCGLSCMLGRGDFRENGGLVDQTVTGGYESTPGNGDGALDDVTSYSFSLCEFCLDWLFSQFKIPVRVSPMEGYERWRPASQRVTEDDWRQMKDRFREEHERRRVARGGKVLPEYDGPDSDPWF